MKKQKWICPIIFIPVILVAVVAAWIVSRPSPTVLANMPLERYDSFVLGESEAQALEKIKAADGLNLIGIYEQTMQGPQWTYHHVQGGPIVKPLNDSEMYQNNFWHNLGWAYPRHPPTQKVIVVGNIDIWNLVYVYLYINDQKVVAIYVGGT